MERNIFILANNAKEGQILKNGYRKVIAAD
jgi:hypothetical protein